MSKLKASRNTFQKSLNRHYYRTYVNPPAVRTKRLNPEEVQEHLNKRSKQDRRSESRTAFDKAFLGL